jgi:tetratricopeptide (TPR) repeat protein
MNNDQLLKAVEAFVTWDMAVEKEPRLLLELLETLPFTPATIAFIHKHANALQSGTRTGDEEFRVEAILGRVASVQGRMLDAIDHMCRAAEGMPRYGLELMDLYAQVGQKNRVLQIANALIEESKDNTVLAEAYNKKAQALPQDSEEVLNLFNKALDINPTPATVINKASWLANADRAKEALDALETMSRPDLERIAAVPSYYGAYLHTLAVANLKADRTREAEMALAEIEAFAVTHPSAVRTIIPALRDKIKARKDELREAQKLAEAAGS